MSLLPPDVCGGEQDAQQQRELAQEYLPNVGVEISGFVYKQARMVACGRGSEAVADAYKSLAAIAKERIKSTRVAQQ